MEKNDILKNALLDAKTELNTTYLDGFLIDVADLVFEERVKMNCYYCGRYNSNWKCPPKLPDIDYPKMFQEFDYCAVVYVKVPFDKDTYADLRNQYFYFIRHFCKWKSICGIIIMQLVFPLLGADASCVKTVVERNDAIIHIWQDLR